MIRWWYRMRQRILNWWNGYSIFRKCQHCGARLAQHYHQRTQYVDPKSNWVTLCKSCTKENDAHWDERWAEYYQGCL